MTDKHVDQHPVGDLSPSQRTPQPARRHGTVLAVGNDPPRECRVGSASGQLPDTRRISASSAA